MTVVAVHVLRSRLINIMVTVALMAGLLLRFGPTPRLLPYTWLAAIAVPLAAADLTTRRLPNRIVLPSYPITLMLLAAAAFADHSWAPLQRALLGMILTLTIYGIPYLLAPNAIGGGDIKLAALLSLVLAYRSWVVLLDATMFTWLLAASAALVLRAVGRTAGAFPLGPCLLVGTFATTLQ